MVTTMKQMSLDDNKLSACGTRVSEIESTSVPTEETCPSNMGEQRVGVSPLVSSHMHAQVLHTCEQKCWYIVFFFFFFFAFYRSTCMCIFSPHRIAWPLPTVMVSLHQVSKLWMWPIFPSITKSIIIFSPRYSIFFSY